MCYIPCIITDNDIKKLRTVFATKDDLKQVEEKMATKDNLKQFGTKNDLKQYATRDDLRQEIARVREENEQAHADLQDNLNTKFDYVLEKLDAVLGEVKAMREEQSMHLLLNEDIDRRLDKIESVPVVAAHLTK